MTTPYNKLRKRKHCHFPTNNNLLFVNLSDLLVVKDLHGFSSMNLSYQILNPRKILVSIKSCRKEFASLSDIPWCFRRNKWLNHLLFCNIWPWAPTTIFPTSWKDRSQSHAPWVFHPNREHLFGYRFISAIYKEGKRGRERKSRLEERRRGKKAKIILFGEK